MLLHKLFLDKELLLKKTFIRSSLFIFCNKQKTKKLRSFFSRSSVNNCGGNCCRGWSSGRSGGCTIQLRPMNGTDSYFFNANLTDSGSPRSSSSPSSVRFSYSGSPNTAVSWSTNSRGPGRNSLPNQATFQAYASVSQNQAPRQPSRPSRPSTNVRE